MMDEREIKVKVIDNTHGMVYILGKDVDKFIRHKILHSVSYVQSGREGITAFIHYSENKWNRGENSE